VKTGWTTKTLGEVLLKTETVNPVANPDAEFNYIDVSSVSNDTYEIEETQLLKWKDAPSRARRLVKAGDVIFATIRPTLKRIARVPADLDQQVCSTGYFVMRTKAELDPNYLFYSLFTETFMGSMESLQKGASYPAVTDAEVRAQLISYPEVTEQRRIITVLDEAFVDIVTAKANAEKNLKNARELFTRISGSVLAQYASTSHAITLEDLVEADCSLSYGIVQPGDEVPNGLHIVRPVDMNTDVVRLEGLKRIDPTLANSYARTTLKGNDILLCVRGTTGTVALAHRELAGANVTRGIVPIRFASEKISQQFGYYLLRSAPAQLQIQAKTYGTALQQINIRDLRQLTLPVPTQQDQEIIVQRLSALEEETKQLAAAYANKLTALDALKKSLLHQAFSGKL
jgi:type I restriction enzyme S subunit